MDENWVLHGIRKIVRDTRGLKIMNEVELQSKKYLYFKTKVDEYQKREQRRTKEEGQVSLYDSRSLVTPQMRWLATQSRMEEDRFLTQINKQGNSHLVKRISSLHKLKSASQSKSERPIGELLVSLYKKCALKTNMKIHPTVIASLRYKHGLELDMDCLDARQELTLFSLVE